MIIKTTNEQNVRPIKPLIQNMKNLYTLNTVGVLLIVLFVARLITFSTLHLALFYDEAYYHFWSIHLDWGYYSKPPLIAWLIALTTFFFGHSEWAVRLASPFLYAGAAVFIYLLTRDFFDKKTALWSTLIFYSSPLVTFNSLFITTDAPLLFFWSLAGWAFIKAHQSSLWRWWILCGVSCGLGIMSKYTMVVLILSLCIYYLIQRQNTKQYRAIVALLIALLIFSPNLYWNAQYRFISFVHTAQISKLSDQLFHFNKLFEFLGGQLLVFGPIAFVALFVYIKGLKNWQHGLFLTFFSWPLLVVMCAQAFLSHANANWAAPAYLGASIIVAYGLLQHRHWRILKILVTSNIMMAVVLFSFPLAQKALGVEQTRHNTPYRRLLGYKEMMANIKSQYPNASKLNWLSNSRMMLSYAHYYLSDWPKQPAHVFSFNPSRTISDEYNLSYDIANAKPNQFIFISQHPRRFWHCFANSKLLTQITQHKYPALKRRVYLYQVSGFKGYENCHH